jgi:ribosomal protein L11 methylase PrmA
MTEKTTLLCSGILDVRLEDVKAALEKAGLTIVDVKAKEDWRSVKVRKI